jgi:hypothetical protein
MPRRKFSTTDLRQLHRQVVAWRQAQPSRTRLPEPLWAAAATLAVPHGVSAVARLLQLDYYKLKRRVIEAPAISARSTSPPAFVELQLEDALGGGSRSCRIELSDAAGGKMTMHLPGDAPAVLALAQAFWRRGR